MGIMARFASAVTRKSELKGASFVVFFPTSEEDADCASILVSCVSPRSIQAEFEEAASN